MAQRGRPRSITRIVADQVGGEGCTRTLLNFYHGAALQGGIKELGEEAHARVFGTSQSFPVGYKGTAAEFGRYIEMSGADPVEEARTFMQFFDGGSSWRSLRAYYRLLRLGIREGNGEILARAIHRTITDYRKNFPKITDDEVLRALIFCARKYQTGD